MYEKHIVSIIVSLGIILVNNKKRRKKKQQKESNKTLTSQVSTHIRTVASIGYSKAKKKAISKICRQISNR